MPHVHGVSRPRTPSRRAVPCSPGGVGGGGGGGAVRYRQTLTAPDTRRGLRPAAGHIHTSPGTIPLCAGSWKWPSVPLSLSATLPTSRTKYMILRFRVEGKTGAHSRGHMYIAGFRFIDLRLGSGHFMGEFCLGSCIRKAPSKSRQSLVTGLLVFCASCKMYVKLEVWRRGDQSTSPCLTSS